MIDKKIHWQRYERIKTGEILLFRKVGTNKWMRKDGAEYNYARMRRYYNFIPSKRNPKMVYMVSPNGFRVRLSQKDYERRVLSGQMASVPD